MKHSLSFCQTFLVFFLLFAGMPAKSQEYSELITDSTYSNTLHDQVLYQVSLPFNYRPSESYPVIYLLDAESKFELTRQIITDRIHYKQLCDVILVGIYNESQQQRSKRLLFTGSKYNYHGNADKKQTFTETNSGKAKEFLNFLTNEFVPLIEKQYPTTSERIVIGHSFAGYFALYSSTLQQVFSTYLLIDPSVWYNRKDVLNQLKQSEETLKTNSPRFFIYYQNRPDYHSKSVQQTVEYLQSLYLLSESQSFPDENHGSVFLPALAAGLKALPPDIFQGSRCR